MKHLDLFTGIGGFALAALQVWGEEYEPVAFCERDLYCQALIKLRFPNIKIYDDVKTLDGTALRGIHLLTGGFPCQPFSQAGSREGRNDERHLWPEMFRVIRETHPTWVIAENVRGLLSIEQGVAFEQVCLDLESIGYEVQAFVIPACAVDAPHRRDRVWIVAHAEEQRLEIGGRESKQSSSTKRLRTQHGNRIAANSDALGNIERDSHEATARGDVGSSQYSGDPGNAPHTTESGLQGRVREESVGRHRLVDRSGGNKGWGWKENWIEVATRLCGVDDGLPARVDGLKLSKSRHRVERLKGLGNAIVPQVAEQIMRAIKETENAQ